MINLVYNYVGTHDIQNISVSSPQPGEVRVTGDFINGSTATGVLAVIITESEIFYHLVERGSNKQQFADTIQGVVGGEHSISFFVVEESGLPFNRTASTPKVVTIENGKLLLSLIVKTHRLHDVIVILIAGNGVQEASIEYSLQFNSSGVCVTCNFFNSAATDCVAVVHQRISQLSSSGLTNIESTHKFTRSGDTASGCIEAVNMDDYQVGVFGGQILQPPPTLPRGKCN